MSRGGVSQPLCHRAAMTIFMGRGVPLTEEAYFLLMRKKGFRKVSSSPVFQKLIEKGDIYLKNKREGYVWLW